MQDILGGLLGIVENRGDLAEVDGFPIVHAHDDVSDILGGFEERAGFHGDLAVAGNESAGGELAVRLLDHRNDSSGAEISRGEPGGIELDSELALIASNERGLGNERDLLHGVVHLGRQPPQREVVVDFAVEGERKDRHIVDRAGLY